MFVDRLYEVIGGRRDESIGLNHFVRLGAFPAFPQACQCQGMTVALAES